MLIMAPADENECRKLLSTAFQYHGPAAVRYPRGTGTGVAVHATLDTLPIGKAELRRRGHTLALLSFGAMLSPAAEVAAELDATLVNMRFVKPLDETLLLALAQTHDAFVTLEDNAVAGGAGSAVAECLAANGVTLPILHLGLPDVYLEHGTRVQVLSVAGLDLPGIRHAILARFPQLTGVVANAG
jgi:1-deoxy-D-xylulose-5-phosphate synthase